MWKVCKQNFQNVERVITKPPQCGKYANKTSTIWKLCCKNFHNEETMVTKLPPCGNYANKTSQPLETKLILLSRRDLGWKKENCPFSTEL